MNYREHKPVLPDAVAEPSTHRSTGGARRAGSPGLLQFTRGFAAVQRAQLQICDIIGGTSPGAVANSTVTLSNLAILQCPSGESECSPSTGDGVPVRRLFAGMGNYMGNSGGPGTDRAHEWNDHSRQ